MLRERLDAYVKKKYQITPEIDRQGNVAARFEPTADMAQVEACVKSLL